MKKCETSTWGFQKRVQIGKDQKYAFIDGFYALLRLYCFNVQFGIPHFSWINRSITRF